MWQRGWMLPLMMLLVKRFWIQFREMLWRHDNGMVVYAEYTIYCLCVYKNTRTQYAHKWQQTREQQPHAKVNDDDNLGRWENFHTLIWWLMGGIGKFALNYYHKVFLWIYFHKWREDNQYSIQFSELNSGWIWYISKRACLVVICKSFHTILH